MVGGNLSGGGDDDERERRRGRKSRPEASRAIQVIAEGIW